MGLLQKINSLNERNAKEPYKISRINYELEPINNSKICYQHQNDAIEWMKYISRSSPGGIIGDAPGLGKTRTGIVYIFDNYKPRNLIVVPPSVLFNWLREILNISEEYNFDGKIKYNIYSGESNRKLMCSKVYLNKDNRITFETNKIYVSNMVEPYIYVVNYQSVKPIYKIDRKKELLSNYDIFEEELTPFPYNEFDVVIADEAHHMKNGVNMKHEDKKRSSNLRFYRMMRLRRADGGVRFALTGTAVQNRYSDIVSIFRWVGVINSISISQIKPDGILSASGVKVEKYEDGIPTTIELQRIDFTNSKFGKLISKFFFRRKLTDLNQYVQRRIGVPKNKPIIKIVRIEYEEEEAKFYASLTKNAIKESGFSLYGGLTIDNKKLLILLNSLLLLSADINTFITSANKKYIDEGYGPKYPYWSKEQTKIKIIIDILYKLSSRGESCIIFTLFHVEIQELEKAIKEYDDPEGKNNLPMGYNIFKISGKHTKKLREREEILYNCKLLINSGRKCILFVQINTGGEGLNMQMFNYQIFTTPHWNPAVEKQAVSRSHRIGQRKQVYVYKLEHNLVQDARLIKSIDKYIRDLQLTKQLKAMDVYQVDNAAMAFPRSKIFNGEYATFPDLP